MRALTAAFIITGLVPVAAVAGPLDVSCRVGDRPGASLLFPYFEVDLAAGDGATTLISINKIGEETPEPTQAHVVVWTDWGLPTLAFDLALETGTVQTFNLRNVLHGEVPPIGGLNTPNCFPPIPPIPIDVEELQARHTGRPDPGTGLCWSSGRLGSSVATGYVTVDVVRDCLRNATPTAPDYFDDGAGVATNDNVLFGELYLMKPGEDFAQGIAALPLVADADLFEPPGGPAGVPDTFYGPWRGHDDSDDRAPLSSRHRARFLHGGDFGGTTELLVWIAGLGAGAEPVTCGENPFDVSFDAPWLSFNFQDESAEPLHAAGTLPPAVAFRLPVGGDELPLPAGSFGTVDVEASLVSCPIFAPCSIRPLQSWIAPLISALGRFSVGFEATRLDDPCL